MVPPKSVCWRSQKSTSHRRQGCVVTSLVYLWNTYWIFSQVFRLGVSVSASVYPWNLLPILTIFFLDLALILFHSPKAGNHLLLYLQCLAQYFAKSKLFGWTDKSMNSPKLKTSLRKKLGPTDIESKHRVEPIFAAFPWVTPSPQFLFFVCFCILTHAGLSVGIPFVSEATCPKPTFLQSPGLNPVFSIETSGYLFN